jgi:Na+-driven multidrug efflux pump
MLDFGTRYLHVVGPFYGLFGFGLALYFAAQGTGRVFWPLIAGLARLAVAAGGGYVATRLAIGTTGVYIALAAAMIVFCAINSFAVASGAWLSHVSGAKLKRLRIVAAVK